MPNYLHSISPIDGRYHEKTQCLSQYFSESALIRYRIWVEVEYFISLYNLPIPQLAGLDKTLILELRKLYLNFTEEDALRVKEIEKITNHDVKAVEYFIKEKMKDLDEKYKDFIHFGLTSQDINNTAFPMMLKDCILNEYIPLLNHLIDELTKQQSDWKDIPMLARTHGQPASPTKLGKEFGVFVYRLTKQRLELIRACEEISGKFGGATGNFNAHYVAFPSVNWTKFANSFLKEQLNINREELTTQISNYDNFSLVFDSMKRIQTIIIDLDRDIWQYISMGYFKQKIKAGEVGSSAMPHKVNPIDFENSEGNLGLSNAILDFLSQKLPISRLQRDLTDSTVIRNIGVPIGHAIIAIKSTLKGLSKLLLNQEIIDKDLNENWPVVAEAIQTILRREGYPNPYEKLKDLTRTNQLITKETILSFIESLDVSEIIKDELKQITPHTYTGL